MSNVVTVTDENFEEEVIQADKPVLVDFMASWCGPCKSLAPVLDELSEERDDIKIVKIDVGGDRQAQTETNPETKNTYGIEVFPTMYLFRDGNIANLTFGGQPREQLSSWLDDSLARPASEDMDAGQAKTYSKEKRERIQEEIEKQLKELAEELSQNLGRKFRMISESLKFAGGVTLSIVSPGIGLSMLGGGVAGSHAADLIRTWQGKPAAFDNNNSTLAKSVSAVFNTATLAAGVALIASPTSGFVASAAALTLGGYMAVTGGINTYNNLKTVWNNINGGPAENAANDGPEQPQGPADGPDCEDGACPLPPRDPDNGPIGGPR